MKPDMFQQIDRIRDLPTLPVIVLKVNRMLQDLNTSAEQLSRIIETDQAMTAKILKLVNSSFYGFKSRIASIGNAVMILGFNTVQHAVVSLSVIKALSLGKKHNKFSIQDFWTHSLAVAVVSKSLSDQADKTLSSDCFTAGLLHDIGKLILAEYFTDHFDAILSRVDEDALTFLEAEILENAVDHARIGAYLSEKWLLPRQLTDAIGHHHSDYSEDQRAAAIIRTADALVNALPLLPESRQEPAPDLVAITPSFLLPQINSLASWYPRLEAEIASACQFFLEPQ